jgi:predicted permease
MFIRIIPIVFPLFAIAALGYFVARRTRPNLDDVNRLTMDVFVPALVFGALASKDFRIGEYGVLAAATFVVVIGSGLLGWAAARAFGFASKTFVPPMMFNNCGNIGLPLAVLAFGEQALAPAVVMFMVSNFLHFSLGAWLLDHGTRLTTLWRIPSVWATLLGLAVSAAEVELWPPFVQTVKLLGDVTIPLMLFALGVRLADARYDSWRVGAIAALARPLIGVVLVAPLLFVLDLPLQQRALLLVFGALPPAVLNYIFAERYRQEPEKVASMVLIGNLAAVVILPIVLAVALPDVR